MSSSITVGAFIGHTTARQKQSALRIVRVQPMTFRPGSQQQHISSEVSGDGSAVVTVPRHTMLAKMEVKRMLTVCLTFDEKCPDVGMFLLCAP